jgi:hypothetical protein
MARRSAVQHGPQTDARVPGGQVEGSAPAGGDYHPRAGAWGARPGDMGGGKRGGGGWSGSGGRWWIWVGRVILWAFVLVVLVNGIRAPFERFTADPASSKPSANSPSTNFPSAAASAYALQFANIYLNHDEARAAQWEQQMKFFLPEGIDPRLGWNGKGHMELQSAQVAEVDVRDANNASVVILAQAGDRQFRVAVPVYTKDGAFVISGRPAMLPPPARAIPPEAASITRDNDLEAELQETLGGFFRAYGSGDTVSLKRFSDNASITSLNGTLTFFALKEIVAPTGSDTSRQVTTTVVWQVPPGGNQATPGGAELEQSYELTMVKKDNKWYVRDIRGSTQPTGS